MLWQGRPEEVFPVESRAVFADLEALFSKQQRRTKPDPFFNYARVLVLPGGAIRRCAMDDSVWYEVLPSGAAGFPVDDRRPLSEPQHAMLEMWLNL